MAMFAIVGTKCRLRFDFGAIKRAIAGRMNALSKADIVRNLFAAYLAGDRDAVEGIFADNFRFTSPFDDRLDKATYFERCWRGSDWIAQHRARADRDRRRHAPSSPIASSPPTARAFAIPRSWRSPASRSPRSTSISAPPIATACSCRCPPDNRARDVGRDASGASSTGPITTTGDDHAIHDADDPEGLRDRAPPEPCPKPTRSRR